MMPGTWNLNRLTVKLGIDYPIIQGPLGGLSSQRLTAAVSNFGGLGSFGAHGLTPEAIKDVIAHLFDVHVMEKNNWTLTQLAKWVETWEPREFERASSVSDPNWRANLATQAENLHAEEEEWQSTREAFAARQKSKRKHGPNAP